MRPAGNWSACSSETPDVRITRLVLDNFGLFNGDRVGPLPAGLTVVHGPNEAGKSALRAFIRVVLFGFSGRNETAWNDYY